MTQACPGLSRPWLDRGLLTSWMACMLERTHLRSRCGVRSVDVGHRNQDPRICCLVRLVRVQHVFRWLLTFTRLGSGACRITAQQPLCLPIFFQLDYCIVQ